MRSWLVITLASCGPAGEPSGIDAPADVSLKDQCSMVCATAATCGAESVLCRGDCETKFSYCRPDYMTEFMSCYPGQIQCSKSQEDCIHKAWMEVPRRALDDEYRSACMTRRTECNDYFPEYNCSSAPFADELVTLAEECFVKECSAIDECVFLALGPLVSLSPYQ